MTTLMDTTETTSVETTDTDAKNSEIIIDLKDSTYARGFKTENQLHADELEKAYKFIDDQLKKAKDYSPKKEDSITLTRDYDTIGVFGDRGSGKTSFILSLLKGCRGNKENKYEDVEVLRMIDPTLVEQKKPMVLCVLGMINGLVEHKLSKSECSDTNIALSRQGWQKVKKNLATGIIAIDNVGAEYSNQLWADESYVLNTGFDKVDKANEFERYFREMLTEALAILGKRAFILAFDDIDVNVAKGWDVLESIRRYFSDPRIITIVSGNLKLYGAIVRENLISDLKNSSYPYKQQMANELESQYMLKILKPEKRLALVALKSLLKRDKEIKFSIGEKGAENYRSESVETAYKSILDNFGITDISAQASFISFLESMSLRSQINFVKDSWENGNLTPSLNVFLSRLYAAGIDIEALRQNANLTNIEVLRYLSSSRNLPDAYLLLPTFTDKDINSNFVALTMLECKDFKENPHLMIDYLLRIGYLRNLILPLTNDNQIQNLIKYAGWNQIMSLKNNVGLTMAYVSALSKDSVKENIPLYRLERDANASAEKTVNAIDSVLKDHTGELSQVLAMFPFTRIANSANNNSQSYYSIFVLLAAIGEILKCGSKEEMKITINDLKLLRTYLKPAEGELNTDDAGQGIEIKTEPKNIKELSELMWKWKESSNGAFIPPYALGRIATRVYNAALNISDGKVGMSMNLLVCALLNACVIEESRVKVKAEEQADLNNSNPQTSTRYFQDNLKKTDIISKLDFSKWMMACPMLNCFVESDVYKLLPSDPMEKTEQNNVFNLIKDLKVNDKKTPKDNDKNTNDSDKTTNSSDKTTNGSDKTTKYTANTAGTTKSESKESSSIHIKRSRKAIIKITKVETPKPSTSKSDTLSVPNNPVNSEPTTSGQPSLSSEQTSVESPVADTSAPTNEQQEQISEETSAAPVNTDNEEDRHQTQGQAAAETGSESE